MDLSTGDVAVLLLGIALVVEVLAIRLVAPRLMTTPFDLNEPIKQEGREYATRALTLGGLTFAAIALLFGSFRSSLALVADSLTVFIFSLSLFLVSYYVEVLVRLKRLHWIIQDKALNFGYVSIVVGLVLLFNNLLSTALWIVIPAALIVVAIHGMEYSVDFRYWRSRETTATKAQTPPPPENKIEPAGGLKPKSVGPSADLSSNNKHQIDEGRRRDKLDDALLFIMGLAGVLFSVFQVLIRTDAILVFLIPIGLLAWGFPFYYGYVRGAVGDSMADRYLGWIYLVLGSGLYAILTGQEEVVQLLKLSLGLSLVGLVAVPFAGLCLLLLRLSSRLRKFVLGPSFPANPVLTRSAQDAVRVSVIIIVAGVWLTALGSPSLWDLLLVVPLTPFAIFYAWRSDFYATRIHRFVEIEKRGPLAKSSRMLRASRELSRLTFGVYVGSGALAILIDFHVNVTFLSQSLLNLFFVVLGVAAVLALPTLVLKYLTRTVQDFDFDGRSAEPDGSV